MNSARCAGLRGLTRGLVEGINGLIQAAKRKARGFRSFRKLRVVIFLTAGKLNFALHLLKLLAHAKQRGAMFCGAPACDA